MFSIVLGFLPALKSGVESNFLSEADYIVNRNNSENIINRDAPENQDTKSIDKIFNHKFRNKQTESGFFDNLPNFFTNDLELWKILIIYPVLILLTFVFEFSAERIKKFLAREIFTEIREKALKKALNANPSTVPKMLNVSGNFSNSIQIGTGNIVNVYDFIADSIQYLFLLVTSIIVLFSTAWLFGLFFLAVLFIQVLLSIRRAKRLKSDREKLDKKRNNLTAQTEEIIKKKEIILAFEQEDRFSSKLTSLTYTYSELTRSLAIRDFLYNKVSNIINEVERLVIPLIALLFFVFINQAAILDLGIFFLITLYARVSQPVLNLLSQYDSLKENEAVSNSLLDLLELDNNDFAKTNKNETEENDRAIMFNNVTFSYYNEKAVFNDLSFAIPKNKTTMILGPSGSGKSSIAKIILGFWPVSKGEIYILGQKSPPIQVKR